MNTGDELEEVVDALSSASASLWHSRTTWARFAEDKLDNRASEVARDSQSERNRFLYSCDAGSGPSGSAGASVTCTSTVMADFIS